MIKILFSLSLLSALSLKAQNPTLIAAADLMNTKKEIEQVLRQKYLLQNRLKIVDTAAPVPSNAMLKNFP